MKPEIQRILIAEACGLKGPFTSDPRKEGVFTGGLPDYLNDLNAMHEAEKVMTPTEDERDSCEGIWCDYGVKLSEICGYNEHDRAWFAWEVYRATAAQRAEALLKTLGKWEDDK